MAVVGERELSARERRMVHMTSDIFGGVDKSVYSTKAQKEMLANLKETFKYVKQVHVPESMNLPSAGEQKKKLMAGNQAVLPGSTTNGPSAAKRDPEFMPKEFWYTLVDLQWHDVRNERCRHKNQMAERVNLGAKEKYLREMSSELFEKVLSSYFGHLKLSTIDPMAVFFKVSEQNELRTEDWKKGQAMLRACGMTDLEGDVALFQDLLRYAKLADVAYAGDEESLRQQLAALQWRFVTGSCEAKPQRPAHFLAMQGKKVLLGVAGTHTIADCLTDCLCDSSPFQLGFAHRGAARASAWLCEEYGESLKYLEENGYEVVLVGHSLGAAVAAACCVQLRAGPGALRTARCVCYAPPATVDPNQAAEAASYITSVVHDDDCIPRMSILSLLELYKSLVSYNWLPKATGLVGKMRADPQQAWFLELGDNAFRKTLEEQLESIWKEQAGQLVEEVKKLEKPRQEAHPLSIPGFIVHLYRCPGGYGIIKALDSNFRSIELSSSMVTDHFLSNYISALETLTAGVSASHHSKLQRLRDFLGDGDDVAEVAVQVHEVAKSVEELVLKARAKLQQRPDTS